ncbi:MAG: OmpH family outer membrane protein [Paludibacteraceae bacterium]|nr:OmpH family outer membrane protein [Paludibacteraceae bacterium]
MKKYRFNWLGTLFVLIGLLVADNVYSAKNGQDIAFIDLQYILKNLPQYESANDQLTLIGKRWQKEIETAEQEARVLVANYQTEQIFLSEKMKKEREKAILDKENEVLELKRTYFGENGELFKKREALLKPIQDEIYTAVQEVANERFIQIVKDRSADPSLIYMSNKLDISDAVLEKLGAK